MDQQRDPRVDEYIASLPDWQARFAERVRVLVHQADDEVEETIKRTRLPVPCWEPRTTSTCSCMTRSRPIRKG